MNPDKFFIKPEEVEQFTTVYQIMDHARRHDPCKTAYRQLETRTEEAAVTFGQFAENAEALRAMGPQIGRPVILVVDITVPDEVLMERIAGRRVCPKCGASYNIHSMKPAKEGVCDRCGAELIQRKDDNPESFKIRLDNYYAQTAPLVDFYKAEGIYHHFDGMVGLEKVTAQVADLLKANR